MFKFNVVQLINTNNSLMNASEIFCYPVVGSHAFNYLCFAEVLY
jgi:hypothetical protein